MLASEARYDLIVIGGGINGAAIAREAQLAGIDTLLIEREDFCSGTSATSTRLIHGGLRYLEHAEFSLVRESLRERKQLLQTAPHLVEPLQIFLPLTRHARRGPLTIRLGMWLYDLLSLGKSLPGHRMLSRDAMLEVLPSLMRDELVGGAAYFDAQLRYPERLVLEIALDAEANGATLANYTTARELLVEEGQVQGVVFEAGGQTGRAFAPRVVNAAGPWVDQVLGILGDEPLIGGTKGSHLIALPFAGAPEHAVYAEARSDGRPFFVIPWNGLHLIGTTDVRFDGDPAKARISRDEFEYLVAETQRLFPDAKDLRQRVCYTCSGIRPLPATHGVREGAITRRHLIKAHPQVAGLFSIVGGKLTTHRSLASDCVERLRLPRARRKVRSTLNRPLPGALAPSERDELNSEIGSVLGTATAARFWHTYGGRGRKILDRVREDAILAQSLGPGSDLVIAELVHAIETERARTLVDLLQRRTMTGLNADFGKRSASWAADWLVRLSIWDKARASEELAHYREFTARHAVPS